MIYRKTKLILILFLTLVAGGAHANIVVVVGADSPIAKLSKSEVREIFLGRKTRYNNQRIRPVDIKGNSPVRSSFYKDLIGKTNSQIKAFRAIQIFSGRGKQPESVNSTEELIRTLNLNQGGIGYIDSTNVDRRVKVVYP